MEASNEKDKNLLKEFLLHLKIDHSKNGKIEFLAYTVIRNLETVDKDASFLEDCVKSKNFTAFCINTLNNNSWTAYEIAVIEVVDFEVKRYVHSFFKPVRPLSKVISKITPQELKDKIENAPDFMTVWKEIEPMLETKVILGPSANRFFYLCDKNDINLPLIAMVGGTGPYPQDWKTIYEKGGSQTDDVMKIALEWVKNSIEERVGEKKE